MFHITRARTQFGTDLKPILTEMLSTLFAEDEITFILIFCDLLASYNLCLNLWNTSVSNLAQKASSGGCAIGLHAAYRHAWPGWR